jgi:Kef-type K+ transport system membrane component KefB
LETRILEQVKNFVAGILLPSYVMVVGGKIDILFLMSKTSVVTLLVIVVLAFSVKVLSSFLVCKAFGISARDGIALGILMNTKGLLALVVINIGVDVQVHWIFSST